MSTSNKSIRFRSNINFSDVLEVEEHARLNREGILQVIEMSQRESDRSSAIVAAADLDVDLENLLTLSLLVSETKEDPLFKSDKLLGTFSSKIIFCYRLGIIDSEIMHALELIRRIRNDFAHQVHESFTSEKQRPRIAELAALAKKSKMFWLCLELFSDKNSSKSHFVSSVSVLSLVIKNGIWHMKRASTERVLRLPTDAQENKT